MGPHADAAPDRHAKSANADRQLCVKSVRQRRRDSSLSLQLRHEHQSADTRLLQQRRPGGARCGRNLVRGSLGPQLGAHQQIWLRCQFAERVRQECRPGNPDRRRQQTRHAIGDGRSETPTGQPDVPRRSRRDHPGGFGSDRGEELRRNLDDVRPPGLWLQRRRRRIS